MEIILLEPVRNLGKIVKVKNGYARNFLFPNKKAIRATDANVAVFAEKKAELEKENAKKQKEAEAQGKKVEGAVVTIIRQAGEDGRLYGSVTSGDVAKALAEAGFNVDRRQVILTTPLKAIGVHTVQLHLHGEVSVNVHPNISRSEDEAADAKARFARGEVVMEGVDATGRAVKQAKTEAPAEAQAAEEAAPAAEGAEAPKKAKKKSKKADADEAAA